MAPQAPPWWGGALADGSVVVLDPDLEGALLSDTSSPTGLQPGAGRRRPPSWRAWAAGRSAVPLPYDGDGHSIGVRRGTLAVVLAVLAATTLTLRALFGSPLAVSPVAWGVVAGHLVMWAGVWGVLLAGVYAVEVWPLKRRGVRFTDVSYEDQSRARYVHPVVLDSPEWEALTEAAEHHAPPGRQARTVHRLLWEAAAIRPSLDTGHLLPDDSARLSEIALFTRGL